MYVTCVRFPSLDGDYGAHVIKTLTEARQRLSRIGAVGFVQSILLRSAKGTALLLTVWNSRRDLQRFLESEEGRKIADLYAEVLTAETELEEYWTSWQALHDVAPQERSAIKFH